MQKNINYLWLFTFLIIIGGIGVLNLETVSESINQKIRNPEINLESKYTINFKQRMEFVNLNGLVCKGLNQKIVNGTIKASNGKLFLTTDTDIKFDANSEQLLIQNSLKILEYAKEQGAFPLFVQRPDKYNSEVDSLPYHMSIDVDRKYSYWLDCMNNKKIKTLDLRKINDCKNFYLTDHHWNNESSFNACNHIVLKLNEEGQITLNSSVLTKKNYYTWSFKKAFLGSEGIRTGKYYTGMDDFNILIPKFKTSFSYDHYINHKKDLHKTGKFEDAFIDQSILKDKSYYNKYNSFIYGGYVESRIVNHKASNNKKVLLISDSFSRPMVQYLALHFKEMRYLDPQEGRYTDSYKEYIKKYKPDIVVLMYNGKINF